MALSLAACGSSSDPDPEPAPEQPQATGKINLTHSTDKGGEFDQSASTTAVEFYAGAVYTPGGNDRINSLQDEDVIVGSGNSADSIEIQFTTSNDNGAATVSPTISKVANMTISFNSSSETNELDMQDVHDVTAITVERINSASATLDNIQNALTSLSISDTAEDTTTVNVSFDDGVLTSAPMLTLNLTDFDVNNLNVDGEDGTGYASIQMNASSGVEINSDFQIDATEALDIDGTGNVTIADLTLSAGHLDSINASGLTGNLTINLGASDIIEATDSATSGRDVDMNYVGAAGDDTIQLDEASLASGATAGDDVNGHDTIDGGTGSNTIDFSVAATADLVHEDNTITNIQTVRIDMADAAGVAGAGETADIDASEIGGLTTIIVRNDEQQGADGNTEIKNFDLNEVASDNSILVQVQHASRDANSTTAANTDVEINLVSAAGTTALGTSELQRVEIISGTNTAESFNFTLDVDGDSAAGVADGGAVERLNIIDSDTEDNTVVVSSIADHTELVDLDGGRADDAFTLSGTAVATTVDATGQLSDTTVTVGTADQSVLMGSGDDTVIVAGANNLNDSDVSFDGGDGSDILMVGYAGATAADIDDLDVSKFETFAIVSEDTATVIEFDNTEEEAVTTLRLLGSAHDNTATLGVTAGNVAVGDTITVEADVISTIQYRGDTGAGTDVFNAATLDGMNTTNTSMAISVDQLGSGGGANAGVLTASETETATITLADTVNFTMSSLTMTSLTSLTVTNGTTATDNGDLTLTAVSTGAMTSVDATGMDGNFVAGAFTNVANDATFTGGAGDDTISIAGSLATGVVITGGAGADTITGNGLGNTINAGAGADQITGGGGQDIINLGSDADADDVFLTTTASYDIISGFDTTEDDVNVGALMTAGAVNATVEVTTAAQDGDGVFVDNNAYVMDAGSDVHGAGTAASAIADYLDLTDVAAFISTLIDSDDHGGADTNTVAGDEAVFVINDTVGARTYVYHFEESDGVTDVSAGAAVSAGEISLVAILTEESGAVLVGGDVI